MIPDAREHDDGIGLRLGGLAEMGQGAGVRHHVIIHDPDECVIGFEKSAKAVRVSSGRAKVPFQPQDLDAMRHPEGTERRGSSRLAGVVDDHEPVAWLQFLQHSCDTCPKHIGRVVRQDQSKDRCGRGPAFVGHGN